MDSKKDRDLVDVLGNDFAQKILRDLGITGDTSEAQAAVLHSIARAVQERVLLEVYSALPSETHDEFDALMREADIVGAQGFLKKHIPDLDRFIVVESAKAYQEIRAHTEEIMQQNA